MAGVIPRAVAHVFDHAMAAPETMEFTVKVSFVEIYLEKIRDLLDGSKDNLQVGEDPAQGGVYIKGVTEVRGSEGEVSLHILCRRIHAVACVRLA